MLSKLPYQSWSRFRCRKLTRDERIAAIWAVTISTPIGFVPDDDEMMRMDTGVEETGCLGSAMEKLEYTKIENGWIMPDYMPFQIGRGSALADNTMASTIIKEIVGSKDKADFILTRNEQLKPLYKEFLETGKISRPNRRKQNGQHPPEELDPELNPY